MAETNNQVDYVTFTINSAAEFITPLSVALNAICRNVTGSESCALDVERAVVEALNNIILHAYKNQEDNKIIVQWYQENRCFYIEIIDNGLSMQKLPTATLPSFDAEGGRGWWIIKSCVDEYNYKVVEYMERHKTYKMECDNEYIEDIAVKSHSNILTLIKSF